MGNIEKVDKYLEELKSYDRVLIESETHSDPSKIVELCNEILKIELSFEKKQEVFKYIYDFIIDKINYLFSYHNDFIDIVENNLYPYLINNSNNENQKRELERSRAIFINDIDKLQKFFECYPDDEDIFKRIVLHNKANVKDKESVCQHGVLKFPESILYNYWNGRVFFEQKKFAEARKYFEKAIEIDSKEGIIFLELARTESQLENYTKALKHYEKAIELKPHPEIYIFDCYFELGQLYELQFKEFEKAQEYYGKIINNEKNYSGTIFTEAKIALINLYRFKYRNETESEKYYTELIKSKPKIKKNISNLTLNNYNQFSVNFELDLTYPKGHELEGEPLRKVCIIGQSGTGKTSLLELIKGYISKDNSNIPNANDESVSIFSKLYNQDSKYKLINYPAHSVENINKLDADKILEYEFKEIQNIVDFSKTDPQEHWYPILFEITKYVKQIIDKRLEITKILEENASFDTDLSNHFEKFREDIAKFRNDDNNPLKGLSEFLKPLLSKFHLQVDKAPSKREDIKFISIESISYNNEGKESKENIQTKFLSTGTKEILSRTVPLFALKPENTIILIDEPENSLYPNVQKEFVDFITKETWHNEKNCQFFFATHSPTIASSFDPWEIVELKFNKNGKVEQKLYYEGERHVDNYTVFPKYLDIDGILERVFDVDDNMYKEREAKIDEFADYNIKIRKLEAKELQDTEEYKALVTKRNEIGRKLDWRVK